MSTDTSGSNPISAADQGNQPFVSPGMPPLTFSKNKVSFFEFWPTWLMYLPVVCQWLLLSIRHRSLTLPLVANPNLKLSGMVGVPKSELLAQATGQCAQSILTWFVHKIDTRPLSEQAEDILKEMSQLGLDFPVVCKPDIGCRGSGVKLVKSPEQLINYLSAYPKDAGVMVQKLASHEAEAGVFFVREPKDQYGKIVSLALKYMPYVVGNGKDSLATLIAQDERANQLQHLYLERHKDRLNDIIPNGEPYRLVFSASHCRGAVFKDANKYVTPELNARINEIMSDLPEFYYGRLDIKFPSLEELQAGKGIEIVEINTASSESLHIWDSDTSFSYALKSLLYQYKTLFTLGSQNRKRGYRTPGVGEFYKHWLKERRLKEFYPETD
ncbi:D-alanine--D-alanine ligase [Sessilibacter sp. MAH2]